VPVRLVRAPTADPDRPPEPTGAARWLCVVVNNMPDGAFEATERQYLGLLDAGSGGDVVEVALTTLEGIPRGHRAAQRIAARYLPLETAEELRPDLLIVTGANPLAARIEDEPFWSDLAGLLAWGREEVPSMLLSCFAAHAGLVVFDGIERTVLDAKCTGVFPQQADPAHPLTAGLATDLVLPHSRLNTVDTEVVRSAGYQVAMHSDGVGWSVITRTRGDTQAVLIQGHPEYDPSSLLREYHRDARRYVLGERDEPPRLPNRCVADDDWEQLEALHHRILAGPRDPAVLEAYPFDAVGVRADWPWRDAAVGLYTNWMTGVTKRSDSEHA
jgi:homoserine O-succinyltransferase/O-acetyltransferase